MEDAKEAARRLTGLQPTSPRLHVAEVERSRIHGRLVDAGFERSPIVVVAPSAGHPIRRWPPERFEEVLRRVAESIGFVIVLEDPHDPAAPEVKLPSGVPGMVWASNLLELRGLLAQADLVLTCDSGIMHLASAVGSRVVSIFGPTSPEWYGPHSPGDRVVLKNPMPCRPCFDRCLFNEPLCMPVETDDVLDAVRLALAEGPPRI